MDKRQINTALAKYFLNWYVKPAVKLGIAPPSVAILETRGRRSGKVRRTPVGNGLQGDTFWIVAEHGRRAGYVRNLQANPRVRVKTRRSPWRAGTAQLMPDDDPQERIRKIGLRVNGAVVRLAGTDPTTVRIDLDPLGEPAPPKRD
jgi:deazaflavin-dependent oxidoreductase (nitroreductase family)